MYRSRALFFISLLYMSDRVEASIEE